MAPKKAQAAQKGKKNQKEKKEKKDKTSKKVKTNKKAAKDSSKDKLRRANKRLEEAELSNRMLAHATGHFVCSI